MEHTRKPASKRYSRHLKTALANKAVLHLRKIVGQLCRHFAILRASRAKKKIGCKKLLRNAGKRFKCFC